MTDAAFEPLKAGRNRFPVGGRGLDKKINKQNQSHDLAA
jgi:hypothetical protein